LPKQEERVGKELGCSHVLLGQGLVVAVAVLVVQLGLSWVEEMGALVVALEEAMVHN
jgi:hypothetical protein